MENKGYRVNGTIYHGVSHGLGLKYDVETEFSISNCENLNDALIKVNGYLDEEIKGKGYLTQKNGEVDAEIEVFDPNGEAIDIREFFSSKKSSDLDRAFPKSPTKLFVKVDSLLERIIEKRI